MFGPWPNDGEWRPIIANRWAIPQGQVEAKLRHEQALLLMYADRELAEADRHEQRMGPLDKEFAAEHRGRADGYMTGYEAFDTAGKNLGLVVHEVANIPGEAHHAKSPS